MEDSDTLKPLTTVAVIPPPWNGMEGIVVGEACESGKVPVWVLRNLFRTPIPVEGAIWFYPPELRVIKGKKE